MRTILELVAAHVLASYAFQALLVAMAVVTGQASEFDPLAAMVLAPVLLCFHLLGAGSAIDNRGRAVYGLLYLLSFVFLRWRDSRSDLSARRVAHGLCPNCGYDLTGNASGICPECGTTIPSKPKTGA